MQAQQSGKCCSCCIDAAAGQHCSAIQPAVAAADCCLPTGEGRKLLTSNGCTKGCCQPCRCSCRHQLPVV
jgi:hypothetical protein